MVGVRGLEQITKNVPERKGRWGISREDRLDEREKTCSKTIIILFPEKYYHSRKFIQTPLSNLH